VYSTWYVPCFEFAFFAYIDQDRRVRTIEPLLELLDGAFANVGSDLLDDLEESW
jgi:hypothetical protein